MRNQWYFVFSFLFKARPVCNDKLRKLICFLICESKPLRTVPVREIEKLKGVLQARVKVDWNFSCSVILQTFISFFHPQKIDFCAIVCNFYSILIYFMIFCFGQICNLSRNNCIPKFWKHLWFQWRVSLLHYIVLALDDVKPQLLRTRIMNNDDNHNELDDKISLSSPPPLNGGGDDEDGDVCGVLRG